MISPEFWHRLAASHEAGVYLWTLEYACYCWQQGHYL